MSQFKSTEQSSFDSWSAKQKAGFMVWFNGLKDVLDENTATNLYDLITTHTSDKSSHVQTLIHTKTGTVHNLTGTIPTSGIVTINFLPDGDWADGDTININGVPHVAYNTLGEPVSGFKTGIPVSAQINTTAKIIAIGGGGEKMKMVQQLELPITDQYQESTPSAWSTTDVAGQPAMQCSIADNGIIYSVAREYINSAYKIVLYKQNAKSKTFTRQEFPDITGYTGGIIKTIVYNSEAYCALCDSINRFYLYKFNEASSTTTAISNLSNSPYPTSCGTQIYHVTNDMLVIISASKDTANYALFGWFYCFSTNTVSGSSNIINNATVMMALSNIIQADSQQNIFRTLVQYGSILYVVEINLGLKNCKLLSAFTPFITLNDMRIAGIQIGSSLMYITKTGILAGKNTGEIDLFNSTIDATKYPQRPVTIDGYNMHLNLIGDTVTYQSTGKTFEMLLSPVLPENMPTVMYIHKGDTFSAPFVTEPIEILPIESIGQPALTITNMPQVATRDYEIHDRQYTLRGMATQLLIKKG